MKAVNLRTDYLENPLGLGNTTPEFFWNCEGGTAQNAYHIVVKKEQAAGTHKIVWDSGEVESASMPHIGYEGEALQSRDRLLWEVSLCDENGVWGEAADIMLPDGTCRRAGAGSHVFKIGGNCDGRES